MAYSVDSSWYLDDIVGIGVYIEEDKDFVIIYHKKKDYDLSPSLL